MQNELEAKQIGANELSKEDMGGVSGGYVYHAGHDQWEVINDVTGDVMGTHSNRVAAKAAAKLLGQDKSTVGWSKVDALRKRH